MERIVEIRNQVRKCRQLIEQDLNWIESSKWTRREYELLLELIFDKTGVLLSLSTIRRIWNDEFKNIPNKSTLDALAVMAGFSSWMNFIELKNVKNEQFQKPQKSRVGIVITLIIVFTILISSLLFFFYPDGHQQDVNIVGDIRFDYSQKSDSIIPNIVVFNYNVENIEADSFFIVESTHNYEKKSLTIKKGQLTSVYHHPGNYEAFLMANDSVIKKLNIEILSNSWIAMINYRNLNNNVPFYFYDSEIIQNGILNVSRDQLIENNIRIEDDIYSTFSNTFDSNISVYQEFTFSTTVKLDSIEINSSSPDIHVGLLFENDLCYVPLTQNGGQGKLQLKYGETILTSNDSDLSGFGCNIYEWQEVGIKSSTDSVSILLNDKMILTLTGSSNMGAFKGFSFNFDGIGSIDYVSLLNFENDTVYYASFD